MHDSGGNSVVSSIIVEVVGAVAVGAAHDGGGGVVVAVGAAHDGGWRNEVVVGVGACMMVVDGE